MRLLVTGVSGYVGAALVPRLQAAGHEVRGFARSQERVAAAGVQLDDVVLGDAISGAGLGRALDGVDAAYYLIHSMEGPANSGFPDHERRAAERFATAAQGGRRASASSTSAASSRTDGRRLAPPRLARWPSSARCWRRPPSRSRSAPRS